MKRKIGLLLLIVVLGLLVACTKKDEPITEIDEIETLAVELTVTEAVEIGETIDMKALVTIGDEKIEDADEVVYEVWEEGKKTESEMIDATNEKEGIYTAETSFDHAGLFHIQVHVTARAQHTMPVKTVTVGDGGNYEENAGHDYHTEGFGMNFVKPTDVEAGVETELVVHIELDEAPLEKSNVRFEIWHEGNPEKHDWVETTEVEAGAYKAAYTFEEAEAYTVVVHVEGDDKLHEHEEHTVEVK